jgi:hypothetical protein
LSTKFVCVCVVAAVALFAGVIPAGAVSGTTSPKYTLNARLSTKAMNSVKDAIGSTGTYTATLTLRNGVKLVWNLNVKNLSSAATRADIYVGPPGKRGYLGLPLCVKCKAPSAHGTVTAPYNANMRRLVRSFLNGTAFVVVATRKNPKGEIRGYIKTTSS